MHWLPRGVFPLNWLSATEFPATHVLSVETYGLVLYLEEASQLSQRMSVCTAQPCLHTGAQVSITITQFRTHNAQGWIPLIVTPKSAVICVILRSASCGIVRQ